MRSTSWLTARPIAHRGLHDLAHGIIENTAGAVGAAIAAGYGVEVDVQMSADGEAMVHHDDVLGRLTEGAGRLDRLSAAELKRVPFRGSAERMMTLGELCDLVAGRVTMLVELKSRFDRDDRLALRVAEVLAGYRGPAAPMSFDPRPVTVLRRKAPQLACGIVAAKYHPHPYWDLMPFWMRHGMGYLLTAVVGRPQFVAYAVADLPALAPAVARRIFCLPLLTWAVRTEAERKIAARFADQMIFEGFRP
ncbi:MAG TPA: glycerophosphodiester phosphodiesterase family protein [Xanthobacteraceae bacterium]|nr:glycerophosphodiester phosphodiesterase family protein [Xanthobacteraceae bacterium]